MSDRKIITRDLWEQVIEPEKDFWNDLPDAPKHTDAEYDDLKAKLTRYYLHMIQVDPDWTIPEEEPELFKKEPKQ